jgi:hypothetical protein
MMIPHSYRHPYPFELENPEAEVEALLREQLKQVN